MFDFTAQRGPFTFIFDTYNEQYRDDYKGPAYRTTYLALGWLHMFISRRL